MSAFLLINCMRPDKTAQALENLKGAKDLLLFCDGAKPGKENRTAAVRELLRSAAAERAKTPGLQTLTLLAENNFGPRQGPLTAIAWAFSMKERAHVIEDDILVAPEFESAHDAGLDAMAPLPKVFAVAEGHPLPGCPLQWIETRMARLVAWSSLRHKILPLLEASAKRPFPWATHGKTLLKGLHPKTQLFLWKEFTRLEDRPEWSWHYPLLQHQLLQGLRGLTPTARLHENTGIDGTGANCINLFGEEETFGENELAQWRRKGGHGRDAKAEKKMETERYGRIHQAVARILYKRTPNRWKYLWRPVGNQTKQGAA